MFQYSIFSIPVTTNDRTRLTINSGIGRFCSNPRNSLQSAEWIQSAHLKTVVRRLLSEIILSKPKCADEDNHVRSWSPYRRTNILEIIGHWQGFCCHSNGYGDEPSRRL